MEPQIENRLPEIKKESLGGPNFEVGNNPVESGELRQVNLDREKLLEEAQRNSESLRVEAEGAIPPVKSDNTNPSGDDTSTDGAQAIAVPDTALDNDLMEKEWLDKLKKMVKDTHDPYLKQQYFRDIQMDYLKKRYGRTLGGAKK